MNHKPLKQFLPWYDSWLKRSQGRPLSLAIRCFNSSTNLTTQLQSLLRPYATQILSLQLQLFPNGVAPEDLLQGLLALQELTIQWTRDYDATDIRRCVSLLPCTLHTLKFQGEDHPASSFSSISTFNSNKVWAQLRNAEINVKHPHYLIYMLRLCPSLSSFSIRISDCIEQPLEPLEPLTHTNLQSLFISCFSWGVSISDMMNALTLPNLRDFGSYHLWLPTVGLNLLKALHGQIVP